MIKRKCPKYVKYMHEHFGFCYIHGPDCPYVAMGSPLAAHHEPPKSQEGSADFRIFIMCEQAHTGPDGRHGTGAFDIYVEIMDVEVERDFYGNRLKPDDRDIKNWCERATRWFWKGFLTLHEYHGPMPKTNVEMWQVLETLGMAEIYTPRPARIGPPSKKRSKKGPIRKGPDYDSIYNPDKQP